MNTPAPTILRKLAYSGWTAATPHYQALTAGTVTTEQALAATLEGVEREWREFWEELKRRDFGLAFELSRRMGERPPAEVHPLRQMVSLSGNVE